ncbi:hypothetical protein LAZ40_02330 [Cereibacter sphaeroides]|uniref:hypothetical protein n=1 Tax=Cereibacter sphaeroides TaxID=1063 RepID=UPI001F1838FE|nr:hypothetical protein [Cereibacter sphaeroides]MCE6957895.1 hypothetical protein [Cereibacter sphaeroides]MCE6971757.1 hypothetical protein [Cereibacter sphaeroides]
MEFNEGRHPYTYSADWLVSLGVARSRADGSLLRSKIGKALFTDDEWISSIFSEAWQRETLGHVASDPMPVPAGFADEDPEAVRAAIGRALVDWTRWPESGAADIAGVAERIASLLLDRQPGGVQLTREQELHLPDLVALAQVGMSLLKAEGVPSARAHPAIAAFWPLVGETLEERRQKRLEEIELRYRFDPDS